MESLHKDSIENGLSLIELYDIALGLESWNITANMANFLNSYPQNEWKFNTSEIVNLIQNMSFSDMGLKKIPCISAGHSQVDTTAGILLSPNYPNNYAADEKCSWSIDIPKGSNLVLKFESFDVEVCKFYHKSASIFSTILP